MKIHHLLYIAVFAAVQTLSAAPLTNESVIKMVDAGLDENTILLAIGKGDNNFDTSADGLIALKNHEVPEAVIQTMIGGASQQTAQSPAPSKTKAVEKSKPVYIELPPVIYPEKGGEYYLRYTLRCENGAYDTTNYARGLALPVNTRVTLLKLRPKSMSFRVADSGEIIKVKNNAKYTGRDMTGMAEIMFSSAPTNISAFPEDIKGSIEAGEMQLGMTKQQVLLARGYPPAHKTPNPKNTDRWMYWSSRFVYVTIVFGNDVLIEGRGLQ